MSTDSPASLSGAASLWDDGFSDYDMGSAAFCGLSQRSHHIVTPVSAVADSFRTIGAQPNPSLYARLMPRRRDRNKDFQEGERPQLLIHSRWQYQQIIVVDHGQCPLHRIGTYPPHAAQD